MVKLADFGIAKAAEQSDITKVGSVLGTAAYLSPEQARGEPAGPASDLYALGVVSYQLMAGRLPYEAASLTDLARLQEAGRRRGWTDEVRDVPPALAAAVARALARDPRRPLRGRGRDGGRAARRARRHRRHRGPGVHAHAAAHGRGDADARTAPAGPPAGARRRLQPIDEPPAAAPCAGPPCARRPAAAQGEQRRRQVDRARARDRCCSRPAVGYAVNQLGGEQPSQLNENVKGTVDDAVAASSSWSRTTRD